MYSDPMQDLQIADNIHKLQEQNPWSVDASKHICVLAGLVYLPWLTLRRFLGLLLFAPAAGGDFCDVVSCPFCAPFGLSITSDPTPLGLPLNCDVGLLLSYGRRRSRVEEPRWSRDAECAEEAFG